MELSNQGIIPDAIETSYLPLPDLTLTDLIDNGGRGGQMTIDPIDDQLQKFLSAPASNELLAAPTFFDYKGSQTDRYTNSDYYKQLGFDPALGQENEYKYGRAQTWGDVMGNALAGSGRLAATTFVDGWKGWGNIGSAIWNLDYERLVGSEEELLALDQQQKDIMNKYAIFDTPEYQEGIFNRKMFGDMVQQAGFSVGTIAQFLSEELLTFGMSTAVSATKLGLRAPSLLGKTVKLGELTKDAKNLGDWWTAPGLTQKIVNGAKQALPMVSTVEKGMNAYRAGAGLGQIASIGVGGLRRSLSEANMAFTEARMEAAGTYGEIYNKLFDEHLEKTGEAPTGQDLERIKEVSRDASDDNFGVNSGILMVMNRLQFDNVFNRIGADRAILKQSGKFANDVVEVTGKKIGADGAKALQETTKLYQKGRLGTFSAVGDIAKDFGKKAAAWEATKSLGRNLFKWEASEGIQELFQEGSNEAIQDYYYDLYHGVKGASWTKSMEEAIENQNPLANMQATKTFLMGALTGRLISPINFAVGKTKEMFGTTAQQRAFQKIDLATSVQAVNAFYENPKKFLPEWIANTKVQDKVAGNMAEAAANRDGYAYNNAKDSGFAKMVSSAIKTNMLESVVDTIRKYGDVLTTEEFKEAFNLDPTEENITSVKSYFNKVADEVVSFQKTYENLKDKYSDRLMPQLFEKGSEDRKIVNRAERALDDAIEMLATNLYKAQRASERAVKIQNEIAQNPNLGSSAAIAIRVLGSDENISTEITLLQDEITNLSQDKSDSAKKLVRAKKKQLKSLQDWQDNNQALKGKTRSERKGSAAALRAYEAYVNAKNEEGGVTAAVTKDDVNSTYELVLDYLDLNQDNKDYVDSFNILANPVQFVRIHGRLMDAMDKTGKVLKKEAEEEVKKAATSTKGDDEEKPGGGQPPAGGQNPPAGGEKPGDTGSEEDTAGTKLDLPEDFTIVDEEAGAVLVSFVTDDSTTLYLILDQAGEPFQIESKNQVLATYDPGLAYESLEEVRKYYDAIVAELRKRPDLRNEPFTFGGRTLKSGDVFISETGRRYMVRTRNAPKLINGVPKIKVENMDDQSSRFIDAEEFKTLLPEGEFEKGTTDTTNHFRLTSEDELYRIYPFVNRDGSETKDSAKQRLRTAILETTQADLENNLSIRIKKNEFEKDSFNPEDPLNGKVKNPKLLQKSEPFSVEIILNGQTIGFLSYYNKYFYVQEGTGLQIPMDRLTGAQFQEIFDVKKSDVASVKKRFENNYKQAKEVYTLLTDQLKGAGEVTLSPEQVNKLLNLSLSPGSYDFVSGERTLTLEDLDYNTVQGFTYILDRATLYSTDGVFERSEGIAVTDADSRSAKQIAQRVEKERFKKDTDVLRNLGRYVAVVELPNGMIRFVELTPAAMPEEDLNAIVEGINERSRLSKEQNLKEGVNEKNEKILSSKVATFNDGFNKLITERLYIALPNRYRGTDMTISVMGTGNLRVDFFNNITKKQESITLKGISAKDPLRISDGKDLVKKINEAIKEHDLNVKNTDKVIGIELTTDNFKQALTEISIEKGKAVRRKTITAEEGRAMMASTNKGVVQNPSIRMVVNPSKPAPAIPAGNAGAKPAAPKPAADPKAKKSQEEELDEALSNPSMDAIIAQRRAEMLARQNGQAAPKAPSQEMASAADMLLQLENQKKALYVTITKEMMAKGMSQAQINKESLRDPRIITINQKIAEIKDSVAKKIITNLSEYDVADINEFKSWVKQNLGDYINVDELDHMTSEMKNQNVTVGQFVASAEILNGQRVVQGSIQVRDNTPFKYHEAFHAVFRLMLKEEKIQQLLDIARQELLQQKSMATATKELLALNPAFYGKMSEKQLEEAVLEEYLADKFDQWKKDIKTPTSAVNKSFFRKLLDFIKSLLGRLKRSPLEKLFSDINTGKFKNTAVQSNRFTENLMGVSEPALKVIKIGTKILKNEEGIDEAVPVYLNQKEGNILISSISSVFHNKMKDAPLGKDVDSVVEEVLNEYQSLYFPGRPYYESDDFYGRFESAYATEAALEKISGLYYAFSEPELRNTIKDAVMQHVQIMGYKQMMEEENEISQVDDLGDRASTDNHANRASLGGYTSLSSYLRKYIAGAYQEMEDDYGNKFLTDPVYDDQGNLVDPGTPMIRAVDANTVYNGILKAVANVSSDYKLLQRLLLFADSNPETRAFVDKFVADTGLVMDEENETFEVTNKNAGTLFQSVIKGFNQFKVNYLFFNKDVKQRKTRIYNANRKDAAKTQFSMWYNAYMQLFEPYLLRTKPGRERALFLAERKQALQSMLNLFNNKKKVLSNDELDTESQELSNQLKDNLGISLSPLYIKYSYVKSQKKENLTVEMQRLALAYDGVEAIKIEDLNQLIQTISAGQNPFGNNIDPEKLKTDKIQKRETDVLEQDDTDQDLEDEEDMGGNVGRLTAIAGANAIFDENVSETSFKNAADELVYAHQMPTYSLITAIQLQEKQYRDALKQDPYLASNLLLNNPQFDISAERLVMDSITGVKSSRFTKNALGEDVESKSLEVNRNKGLTYGDLSDREFMLINLELYSSNQMLTMPDGTSFYTARIIPGVLEASNTVYAVSLPVIDSVEKVKGGKLALTNKAAQALIDEVKREYERIGRVQQEITDGYPNGIIEGYHNKEQRGLTLFKTKNLLGAELTEKLEQAAIEGKNFDDFTTDILSELNKYWFGSGGYMETFIEELVQKGILYRNKENQVGNILLDSFIYTGFTKDGKVDGTKNNLLNIIPKSIEHNLAQIVLNDFIYTLSFNQLLQGDPSELYKDDNGIDETKRNKAKVASGPSIASTITDPARGVLHNNQKSHLIVLDDPKFQGKFSGKTADKTDAQMFLTTKALRYTLFGLGRLTQAQADVLDKIERGEDFTAEDIFGKGGSIAYNAQTNSLKLVYFDGKKYQKTSAVVLAKKLTSYFDKKSNSWKARPQNKELHDLRVMLERYEQESLVRDDKGTVIDGTIGMAIFKSGSKMLKKNVLKNLADAYDSQGNLDQRYFTEHDNRFWRLQLENPSNKILITDPTQAKQIILAEQDDSTEVYYPWTDENGNSVTTVGQLKEIYKRDSARRIENKYVKARNEIFTYDQAMLSLNQSIDINKITPDLERFLKRAVEQLSAQGADTQLIEFFNPENGGYDLNNNLTLDKFTSLFFAYFSKGVLSEKVPGYSIALMTNYGMRKIKQVTELDENGQPKRWRVVQDREFDRNPDKFQSAKDWDNDQSRLFTGLQVGDYFIDDLRHNVAEYEMEVEDTFVNGVLVPGKIKRDKNGEEVVLGRYTEFVIAPHHREMMNLKPGQKIPDEILKALGVRIPSQDKHSFVSLKLVDFLPAHYGSTGVFPHELIEISGADFDIDKLYITIRDFYSKNGEMIPFGSAQSEQERFEEFVQYMLKTDKEFREKVAEAADQELVKADNDETEQVITDLNQLSALFENTKEDVYSLVLEEMGLPSTAEKYKEYVDDLGELNNGVLNNRILDAKLALLTNKHVTAANPQGKDQAPIAFQVATTDPLKDLVENFRETFGEALSDILEEGGVPIDSIWGKVKAFKNNKEGAKGIGPVVNAMLVYSMMNDFKVKIRDKNSKDEPIFRFTIDGKVFDSYEHTRSYNPETGVFDADDRIFFLVSTLVSAMTDNAKERLAARLGLNIEAIGILTNMVAQGVPLRTAAMMFVQPVVREYYRRVAVAGYNIKSIEEESKFIKSAEGIKLLQELEGQLDADAELKDLTTDLLEANIRNGGQDTLLQYTILSNFLKLQKQSEMFTEAVSVLKLTKGPGSTHEDVDKIQESLDKLKLEADDADFAKSDVPFDLRQILTGKDPKKPHHNIAATNYKIFKQAFQNLSKTVFLQKTDIFMTLEKSIKANFHVKKNQTADFNKKLRRDLISYLSIKAYMKRLKDTGSFTKLTGLDNALIYDEDAIARGEDFTDIIDTVKQIRDTMKDNYFARQFLNIIPTTITDPNTDKPVFNPANRGGINTVEGNTWAKLSTLQQEKLQDSFMEIYTHSEEMRKAAWTLFNYLLVKDGGQFKSGSFIRLMPPMMFRELMRATGEAVQLLKGSTNDTLYKEVFDADFEEVINEFLDIYATNTNNKFYFPLVYPYGKPKQKDKDAPVFKGHNPDGVVKIVDNGNLVIDMFYSIRKEEWTELTNVNTNRTEFVYLKKRGKFSDDEKQMLKINKQYLEAKNLSLVELTDDQGKKLQNIQFPYTLKVENKDDVTGFKTIKYYKLQKVGKEGSDTSGFTQFIDVDSEQLVANGVKAVYVPFEPMGSSAQSAIGGMFGPLASTDQLLRKRRAFNSKKYGLDALANMEDLDFDAADLFTISMPDIDGLAIARVLFEKYGVQYKAVGNTFEFTQNGKKMETTARTPNELLEILRASDPNAGDSYEDQMDDSFKNFLDSVPLPTLQDAQPAGEQEQDDNLPGVPNVDTGSIQMEVNQSAQDKFKALLAAKKLENERKKQEEDKDKNCPAP